MSADRHETSPWWGIALIVLGGALIAGGLLLGGTWADVAIEVGAAAGVGGIVLLFKNRFMRQVDVVATQAAEAHTKMLTERITQIENIGNIQANEIERQRSEIDQIRASAEENVTFSNIRALLLQAYNHGFFADSVLLKTSTEIGRPLLEISPFGFSREDQLVTSRPLVFFRIFAQVAPGFGNQVQYGAIDDSTAVWHEDEDVQAIIGRILGAYRRSRLPQSELDSRLSFRHLLDSFQLMSGAMSEQEKETNTPTGKLVFLINGEWVLTDIGLQRVRTPETYTADRNSYGEWVGIDIEDLPCPAGHDPASWNEAKQYITMLELVVTNLCS